MIIIGIDPGIALVGYGVIYFDGNRLKCIEYGCIETFAHTPITDRLSTIHREMASIIQEFKPDEIAFEELFFHQNKKTAIMVAQARGVEVLTAIEHQIPIYEYTPLQIKQAITGYGRAGKEQIQRSVQALLRLDQLPKPDDAADGLAIAICHAFGQRFKEENLMR